MAYYQQSVAPGTSGNSQANWGYNPYGAITKDVTAYKTRLGTQSTDWLDRLKASPWNRGWGGGVGWYGGNYPAPGSQITKGYMADIWGGVNDAVRRAAEGAAVQSVRGQHFAGGGPALQGIMQGGMGNVAQQAADYYNRAIGYGQRAAEFGLQGWNSMADLAKSLLSTELGAQQLGLSTAREDQARQLAKNQAAWEQEKYREDWAREQPNRDWIALQRQQTQKEWAQAEQDRRRAIADAIRQQQTSQMESNLLRTNLPWQPFVDSPPETKQWANTMWQIQRAKQLGIYPDKLGGPWGA